MGWIIPWSQIFVNIWVYRILRTQS